MKQHRYYFLYKTTNLINGKFYIGQHQTDNLDDGYLGSGKLLLEAIEQFGENNFKREILQFFPSWEELNKAEREVVTKDFVKRDDVYNIREGGRGMDDQTCVLGGLALREKLRDPLYRAQYRKKQSQISKENWKNPEIALKRKENLVKFNKSHPNYLRGCVTKNGKDHCNYGKIWICNKSLGLSIHWNKADPIPDGWVIGMCKGYKQFNHNSQRIWIYREDSEKRIDERLLDAFKSVGWKEGRLWHDRH